MNLKFEKIITFCKILCVCFIFTTIAHAQVSESISGTITDTQGNPIPGVSITVKGTTTGVISDINGHYSLDLSGKNKMVGFSFIGYVSQTIDATGKNTLNVVLEEDLIQMEEVVIIGYGQQKKSDLTGAIVNVNTENIKGVPSVNLSSGLAGRLAGVSIQQNGGGPNPDTRIRIRGIGSMTGNDPLIVIDDIIGGDINSINPSDIETMTVLKDASAAAIYGSRGANGVVLIKTKRGSMQTKTKVNVDAYYGFQNVSKKIDMLSASDLAVIYNEASKNDGTPPLAEYANPSGMKDLTNWQDEVFRTAPIQNYNVSIMGGGANNNYNVGFNVQDTEGVLLNTFSKRYTVRFNSDYAIGSKFKFGESISLSYLKERGTDTRGDNAGTLIQILGYHPDIAVYDKEGKYSGVPSSNYGDLENPVGRLERNTARNRHYRLEGNAYLQYQFLPDLMAKVSGSLIYNHFDEKRFHKKIPEAGRPSFDNSLFRSNSITSNWIFDALLNYDKKTGLHKINATAGFTAQHNDSESYGGTKTGFDSEDSDFWFYTAGTGDMTVFDGYGEDSMLSWLLRLNYTYADKYLFSFNMRGDGSSKFSKENHWSYFPSFSVAWRMTQENFMNDITWLDDLKLRVSYGSLGNQAVGNYKTYSLYRTGWWEDRYFFGPGTQSLYQGASASYMANKDLKWETTIQGNIGIDAVLLKNRLFLTLDAYHKKTKDILVDPPQLGVYGNVASQSINGATVVNKGLEATLTYNDKIGRDFTYGASFNISKYSNEVTSLGNNAQPISGPGFRDAFFITRTDVGYPIGFFYGYTTNGIFQSDAEVQAYKNEKGEMYQPNASAGDFRFVDINQDGIIDSEDRDMIGNAIPDFTYGLNIDLKFKDFDLNLFFQGVQGVDAWNALRYTFGYTNMKYNYYSDIRNRWNENNKNNETPRATWLDPNNNRRPSGYYVEDGSYLKLKNIALGYTLPGNVTRKINIHNARFFVSAQNLFTITSYSGYDPELGIENTDSRETEMNVDRGQYPQSRIFTFGVNLTF